MERELITQEQFGAALLVLCVALFAILALVGIGQALYRRRWHPSLPWLYASISGPLLYGLWRFYTWTIRYHPETGTAGLHRVSVLLLDLLAFIALGAGLGYLTARLFNRRGPSSIQQPAGSRDAGPPRLHRSGDEKSREGEPSKLRK